MPQEPITGGYWRPAVPSDVLDVRGPVAGVYVGGGTGQLMLVSGREAPVKFRALPGTFLPVAPTRIMAASTTATDILLWMDT
jgi:hypothetical protein